MAFNAEERDALIGETIGGCLIEAAVGGGATSHVFLARHLALEKRVAIKLLDSNMRRSQAARDAFFEEAKIAASIEHANVIPIFDVGQEGELCYITMRYLNGASLYRVLSRQGIEQLLATRIAEQIASALGAVHERGFVHRDIKPENILLTQRGQAFLTDFGVASPIGRAEPAGRGGSPAYMSPEQCRGEELDGRSDFYSLGVTLYQMLSGRRPFLGESSASLMLMHQQDDFPPLRSLVKDVIPVMARLVESLLAKSPQERPENAEAIVAALNEAQEEIRALRRRSEGMRFRRRESFGPSESGFHRLVKDGLPEDSGESEERVEDVELGLLLGEDSHGENGLLDDGTLPLEGEDSVARRAAAKSRFEEALRVIDTAIAKRKDDPNLHVTRGNVLRQQGDLEEAEKSYRHAYELAPNAPRAMTALGACLRLLGRITEAETLLKEALQIAPNNVEARISLGKIYENAGASSLARQQYIKVTREAGHDERGFVALGMLMMKEEKYENAALSFERARQINPSFAPTLFWLGVVAATRHQRGEAIDLLEKAVKAGLQGRRKLFEMKELEALRQVARFQDLLKALHLVKEEAKS